MIIYKVRCDFCLESEADQKDCDKMPEGFLSIRVVLEDRDNPLERAVYVRGHICQKCYHTLEDELNRLQKPKGFKTSEQIP